MVPLRLSAIGVDTQLTYKPTKSKFLKPQDVGTRGQGFGATSISMADLKLRNDAAGPGMVPLLNQHGDSVRAEFIKQETD
jgi:hypothetical protein